MSETDRLGDDQVVTILDRAARGINPVLDLALTDPFGIKSRTFTPTAEDRSAAEALLDVIAWVLDTVQFPGTASWEKASDDERAQWWVTRIGALNTIAVAFPGTFGVLLNRLPIQDVLGFANQAVVLVAVAREHGVTNRFDQVDLLASVLCRRETDAPAVLAGTARSDSADGESVWLPFALIGALWRTARTVRALSDELDKRPGPGSTYSLLGNIPVVGVVAGYLGERGALVRAAKAGEQWIASRARLTAAVRRVR
ncbi:hypothetical protein [Rhodococcus opacus]|uniref:hypothetical protein n=1 Tax=Rhodococcus opacus TaxID=37919 RepID=UPI000EA920BF|nr:hypothetical protein [Rhodococcus opacus]QZS55137.1 hypothetical protein FXW36_34130 [Rhodococcus opacus]RKM71796.1 hypothetical protein COO55_06835 [Rhodococcus opacus]